MVSRYLLGSYYGVLGVLRPSNFKNVFHFDVTAPGGRMIGGGVAYP